MKENNKLKILCPYCGEAWTAKMLADYDYAGESEMTGRWGESISIKIYCDNCKKLVYKKNTPIWEWTE